MTLDRDLILALASELTGNDADFFTRVWRPDRSKYLNRLQAIGFEGKDRVLDAGCGVGQWLIPLAELNHEVVGIEHAASRVNVVRKLVSAVSIDNVTILQGSIHSMPFDRDSFDAVFCYGVIFLTDFRRTLAEFGRILKPAGTLYLTGDGLGWFLYLLHEEQNRSATYDPRTVAIEAIEHSLGYFSASIFQEGKQLIIPSHTMRLELEKLSFHHITTGAEGTLSTTRSLPSESFYPRRHYLTHEFIYEVLAEK